MLRFIKLGKIGQKLFLSIIILGFLLVSLVLFTYWEIDRIFVSNFSEHEKLNTINDSISKLYQSLIDQETGQRGYNLTGESEFLEPFSRGKEEFQRLSAILLEETEENERLKYLVRKVIDKGQYWHDNFGLPQIELTKKGLEPTVSSLAKGKETFDEVRQLYHEALVVIDEERVSVRFEKREEIHDTLLVLLILSIGFVLVLLVSYFKQTKSIINTVIDLGNCVESYSKKDFAIDTPAYNKEDELGHLIKNINEMRNELRQKFNTMESLSLLDGLTGIKNRRFFDEALKEKWESAKSQSKPLSLILFDIDHFKSYNDTYGHLAGDECLKIITKNLDERLQDTSYIFARYGGEEFAVILPELNDNEAVKIADSLRKTVLGLKIPHIQSSVNNFVTISLGVASLIPSRNVEYDYLISLADKALYQSKSQGRNQVTKYSRV